MDNVYSSEKEEVEYMYMSPSDVYLLAKHGENEKFWGPRWSPDGKYIAFVKNKLVKEDKGDIVSTISTICIVDIKTKKIRQLTEGPDDSLPQWTHDGRIMYLERKSHIKSTIKCIDKNGQDKETILEEESLHTFSLSPDNKKILLIYSGSPSKDINNHNLVEILNLISRKRMRLVVPFTTVRTMVYSASWHPNSEEIAYIRQCGFPAVPNDFPSFNPNNPAFFNRLFIFDLKTRKNKEIIYDSLYSAINDLSWSPDSKWIAYCKYCRRMSFKFKREKIMDTSELCTSELWVVNLHSGYNFYLISSTFNPKSPEETLLTDISWSPDSKKIAFISGSDIYIGSVTVKSSPEVH